MGENLTNLQSFSSNTHKAVKSISPIVLECVRNNLITVIGYELWNPLSTIQVCLESLASEVALPETSKQVIVDTALKDVQALHKSIETCINFSQVEIEGLVTSESNFLKSPTTAQQILNKTLARILELNKVQNDLAQSEKIVKILNEFVAQESKLSDEQEAILEHIRSNLIAIVGHEIRTPLCTIEVCLESLSNETDIPLEYRQKMLDIALKDIRRLQKLIKDFFILDRLEKGQVYYRSDYVKVSEVIDLALDSLRDYSVLPQITVEIPPKLPLVKVDEDILVKALIELLDNACKFTNASGKIKIKARVTEEKVDNPLKNNQENIMLEVIISDNGRGIIPNHLEAIFNCFYQEENFLRRTVNGTGIGLTICRYIINSLGGKIWAKSPGKDQGSSIHFTLPIAI